MSWGISPWGTSPWGGIPLGQAALLLAPAFVNSRPYPVEITPLSVVTGGVNNIVLGPESEDEPGFYDTAYMVYFGSVLVARRVQEHQSGRVIVFDEDFPTAIPNGETLFLYADDTWLPDLLHVGVRPSPTKMLQLPTLTYIHSAGTAVFDGVRPELSMGVPAFAHEDETPEDGDNDYFVVSATAPGTPANNNEYNGLAVTWLRGAAAGETRRIIRYDGSNRRAYVDTDFVVAPKDGDSYSIQNIPLAYMQHLTSPINTANVDIDGRYAGLLFTDDGATHKATLVAFKGTQGSYNYTKPIQLQTIIALHSVTWNAGRAGIVFGFVLPGLGSEPILGFKCEIMHDGGGAAGDLILRISGGTGVTDFVLVAGADPSTQGSLVLSCSLTYDPHDDDFNVSVNSLFPLPGESLVDSGVISNIKSGGGFAVNPIAAAELPPLSYFGAGLVGADVSVQFFKFAFLDLSDYIVREGVVRGFLDGDVLSALPNKSESNLLPLQWKQPWRPVAGGRRKTPESITIGNSVADGSIVMDRTEFNNVPFVFARNEPQLESLETRGFVYTFRVKTSSSRHDPLDVIGTYVGAVVGPEGQRLEVRVAFIEDLGTKLVGIRISSASEVFLDDHLRIVTDWEEYTTYRLVYEPGQSTGSQFLALFIGDESFPSLFIPGSTLAGFLPNADTAPILFPGFYFGLMRFDSVARLDLKFCRYTFNGISYLPQFYFNEPTPIDPSNHIGMPHNHPLYPWTRSWSPLPMATFISDVDSQRKPINAKVQIKTEFPAELTATGTNLVSAPAVGSVVTYATKTGTILSGTTATSWLIQQTSGPLFTSGDVLTADEQTLSATTISIDAGNSMREAFFERSLQDVLLPAEMSYGVSDGFVAEFRMQVDSTLPISGYSTFKDGIWTGIGVTVDDGVDRVLLGFAEGGARGKFIFIAGPDPETGVALQWADIQKWVDDAIRRPTVWRRYIHYVDWTVEKLYRLERSAAVTSDRNASINVFVDDEELPVLSIPFRRGKQMDGTVAQEGLTGGLPRIVWGHLAAGFAATSYWREMLYSVSAGYDIHTNQLLSNEERLKRLSATEQPVLASKSVTIEEA